MSCGRRRDASDFTEGFQGNSREAKYHNCQQTINGAKKLHDFLEISQCEVLSPEPARLIIFYGKVDTFEVNIAAVHPPKDRNI